MEEPISPAIMAAAERIVMIEAVQAKLDSVVKPEPEPPPPPVLDRNQAGKDYHMGIMLFRARMELDGRYEEFKALRNKIKAESKGPPNHNKTEVDAALRMGYEGYESEKARLLGMRGPQEPTKGERMREAEEAGMDVLSAITEAWNKVDEDGLVANDFIRRGAHRLWKMFRDPKTEFKMIEKTLQHLLGPQAKAMVNDEQTVGKKKKGKEERARIEELERMLVE